MIPKIIHYCWFSNDKKPRSIERCIKSWRTVMPDYTIKCWDGNSFDFSSIPFVRDAMAAKKYAFAADYVRLFALYKEGGIYLDSDVEVKKSFEPFQNEAFFCGTEAFYADNTIQYRMESAIMGAEMEHPFVAECIDYYKQAQFSDINILMPVVISEIAHRYDYKYCNKLQKLSNSVTIYPTSIFSNDICPEINNINECFAIHHNAGSWIEYKDRGWLFRFCRKNDMMNIYHWLEKIRK